MYGQIGAVTGLRKKPSYTDIINAETPYLPGRVQARKDRQFQETTQAWNEAETERQRIVDDEAAHNRRKQANRAQNLGYANLGINVLGETGALGDLYDTIMGLF